MQSSTFWAEIFPKNSAYIVVPIVKFLHSRGISLTAYMEDFTNQAQCRCKVIFETDKIALIFMSCG